MKVYIAGPMTGLPGFNYPAFEQAEHLLRRCGHDPINPTFGEPAPTDATAQPWEWYSTLKASHYYPTGQYPAAPLSSVMSA